MSGLYIVSGGTIGYRALVTPKGRLETLAIAEDPLQDAVDDGNAYSLTSTYSATGGQEVMSLQNDSASEHIHLHSIMISSQELTTWNFFKITSATAPGGTAATVTNMNLTSGKAFTSRGTAFGNASVTGSLSGDRIYLFKTRSDVDSWPYRLYGAPRMEQGDKVALTLTTGTTNTVEVTLVFFYA